MSTVHIKSFVFPTVPIDLVLRAGVCVCARTGFLKADKHANQCFYDSISAVIYEPALLQTHQLCLASTLQNDIISVLEYSAANKKLIFPVLLFHF